MRFLGDACHQSSTANQLLAVVQTGTLIVAKTVINDHGGSAGPADFTIAVAGTAPNPSSFPGSAVGTTVTLAPGGYSVTEGGPAGYTATYSTDCSGTIAAGETKTCAITNDDNPTTGTNVQILPGAYTISESGPAGYAATYSAECSGSIAIGEIRTCTIINDDAPAPTSTVVTSAPNPSRYGFLVTLIATVTGSRGPSGTVQYLGTPVITSQSVAIQIGP